MSKEKNQNDFKQSHFIQVLGLYKKCTQLTNVQNNPKYLFLENANFLTNH